MELKHQQDFKDLVIEKLLIVPYGIETKFLLFCINLRFLLIVPYGIETAL